MAMLVYQRVTHFFHVRHFATGIPQVLYQQKCPDLGIHLARSF